MSARARNPRFSSGAAIPRAEVADPPGCADHRREGGASRLARRRIGAHWRPRDTRRERDSRLRRDALEQRWRRGRRQTEQCFGASQLDLVLGRLGIGRAGRRVRREGVRSRRATARTEETRKRNQPPARKLSIRRHDLHPGRDARGREESSNGTNTNLNEIWRGTLQLTLRRIP